MACSRHSAVIASADDASTVDGGHPRRPPRRRPARRGRDRSRQPRAHRRSSVGRRSPPQPSPRLRRRPEGSASPPQTFVLKPCSRQPTATETLVNSLRTCDKRSTDGVRHPLSTEPVLGRMATHGNHRSPRAACRTGTRTKQGPEARRNRPALQHRDRRRLHGARLQPGRDARRHCRRRSAPRPRSSCCWRSCRCCSSRSRTRRSTATSADCGTSFTWVARAFGPHAGWLTGWAIIIADIIVMAALAQIAGIYGFLLVGQDSLAENATAVTAAGCVWILIMTLDLVARHRALRPHPVLPARRRADHPGRLRGRRAGEGLRRHRGRAGHHRRRWTGSTRPG